MMSLVVVSWATAMHRVMVLDGRVMVHAGRMMLSGVSGFLNVGGRRRSVLRRSCLSESESESGRGRQRDCRHRCDEKFHSFLLVAESRQRSNFQRECFVA